MTTELVAFPDVETILVTYLSDKLTELGQDARVATDIPNPRPPRLVRVTRTGGVRVDVTADAPQITLEAWDPDPTAAFNLSMFVRALVWALAGQKVGGVWFRKCEEASANAWFPDPTTESPRYQTTVTLTVRGEPL